MLNQLTTHPQYNGQVGWVDNHTLEAVEGDKPQLMVVTLDEKDHRLHVSADHLFLVSPKLLQRGPMEQLIVVEA